MKIYNIKNMIEKGDEEVVKAVISSFSCAKTNEDGTTEVLNPDIENFLFNNAIQFAKMKTAITYLVFDEADAACLDFLPLHTSRLTFPRMAFHGESKTRLSGSRR